MALTVGTNTYVSEADADTYIELMGLAELSAPEALLKRATQALDRLYGSRFIGSKATSTQALAWPRIVVEDIDSDGNARNFTGIPTEVANATVELALLMDSGSNVFAQPEPMVTKETVQVDVISQSREYASAFSANALHSVALVLRPLLASTFGARLVRG